MLIVFGCDAQATYSEYSLAGSWESTNEYDYFSEASSRVARAESAVFETHVGPISSSSILGTLPKAVIIRYDESMPKSRELATSIGKYGKEVPRAEGVGFDFSRIEIPADETTGMEEIINYYEQLPGVSYVEEDHRVSIQASVVVNDPGYPLQWNLQQLGMPDAWGITTGNSSVVVAIIDTGIAEDISDFAGTTFVDGWNFVGNNDNTYDDNGHGTHVSGTVAQTTNNSHGTAGMAYGVALMPIKVLDGNGEGYSSDFAAGIIRAADSGADIINLSLAGGAFNQTAYDAIRYAYEVKGVAIFASSGNSDAATVDYPAAYGEYVIAVGATDRNKARAYYSNYGSMLDIVAPGGDISIDPSGGILQQTVLGGDPSTENFYYYQGTSMAAPHASALGALLLSRNPLLSPAEILTAIATTAEDLGTAGKDEYYGYGLISPVAALESVSSGISAYPVSDSINIQYVESENHYAQWFFNAASGDIHLTLSSSSSSVTMTLYDPEGVEIKSTVEAPEQEIIHNIGASGGEFSVVVQ
ncbi:MAG: S8 family peptidase [Sphaerochaetaceae bacterium]